jgi:hypothetical protein
MTTHNLYTISDTAPTIISTPGLDSGADITIQNVSSTSFVYIGGEGVSGTSYGFKLSPHQAFSVELIGEDEIYLIADTNNTEVAVFQVALERTF